MCGVVVQVMILLDDVMLMEPFSLDNIMQVMLSHNFSVASPGACMCMCMCINITVTRDHSRYSCPILPHSALSLSGVYGGRGSSSKPGDPKYPFRHTHTIEIFATIFSAASWECWYDYLDPFTKY